MSCYPKIPCIMATSVTTNASLTTINLPAFVGAIPLCGPAKGCVNIIVPPTFMCDNTNPVVITADSVTYQIINRCGNLLRTDQLSRHCCKFALHLHRPSDTIADLCGLLFVCQDKLCKSRYVPPLPESSNMKRSTNKGVA